MAFKLHDWLMDVNYLQHTDDDLDGYGMAGMTDPYYQRKYRDPLGEQTVAQRLADRSVISGGPRVSPEMVKRAIEGARADLARDRESTRDSAGTRLMRAAGYDGIDVRHLDERLDGTGMGRCSTATRCSRSRCRSSARLLPRRCRRLRSFASRARTWTG